MPTAAERVSWADLHLEARAMAADLQARGFGAGSHVALLGPTSREMVVAIEAVWIAGATLVVLPLPMRLGSIEEFVVQTRRRMAQADVDVVVLDRDLAPFIEGHPADPPMILLHELRGDADSSLACRPSTSCWSLPEPCRRRRRASSSAPDAGSCSAPVSSW